MRSILCPLSLVVGAAVILPSAAAAAPAIGANPAAGTSTVQPIQEFGIYVGPRYRYYSDPYWGYGSYGYGYRPYYYYYDYGPRYYYGYRSDRRYFRGLERRAP